MSTLYTISYLYLYVGLLPSRDPHILVNGRQVLLYCINTSLFILFSFALLPRGYIYTYRRGLCIWWRERVYENFSGTDEWIDPSLSALFWLLFSLTSYPVGVSVCIAPNFFFLSSFLFHQIQNLVDQLLLWLRVLYFSFVQFVTIVTPLFLLNFIVFSIPSIFFLLTGRLFFLPFSSTKVMLFFIAQHLESFQLLRKKFVVFFFFFFFFFKGKIL